MNYYDKYLEFYSGENRKAIFQTFCAFIEAWRDDDREALKSCLSSDVLADISMTGHHEGIDNVCRALKWPGPKMDIRRITINSFIARSHNGIGQQSAYTQHIYAQEDEENVYPFTFGGQFCNSFVKRDGHWKISHIRFDLCYEDGNNYFVKGKWRLMDYGILYGHLPMINPELEAPWIVIPVDSEPLSDEEEIFELEYRNNIGMDGGAFHLSHEIFSDEIFLNYSAHQNVNKNYSTVSDGDYYGRKAAINYFKGKQHKEARLQHIVAMAELIFNEDRTQARAYMLRSEYNRTKHHIFNKKTIHSQPLSAIHEIDAICENGVWKMKRMSYYPIMEFIPMDDDCILFDDYIVNQKYWFEIKNKLSLL